MSQNSHPIAPQQPVRVQSGVALGMKIALGFVLFMMLATVGSCVACAACTGGIAALGVSEGARIETVELDLSGFETALDIYKRRNGRYPSEAEGLSVLYSEGILLGKLKQDPWGRDYVYAFPGRINPEGFDLYSLGASGDGIISHQAE